MKKKQDIVIKKYFNYMHVMIVLGIIFYFVAYILTVYGLTTKLTYEINPFMRSIIFQEGTIMFFGLFYGGLFAMVILYKFLLDYIWQFKFLFNDWMYWLRAVMTSSYLAFALYMIISGTLDMFHDIAVLQGVWYLYG